jgi:uncharacterized protein
VALKLVEKEGAVRFEVHAKPRAKRSRILGVRGEALEVSLAAPPVDGAANAELVRVLSEALEVPKRQITIVRGDASQKKLIEVRPGDATMVAVIQGLAAKGQP